MQDYVLISSDNASLVTKLIAFILDAYTNLEIRDLIPMI